MLKKNNRMNSTQESHTDEINNLLNKIDKYSLQVTNLQAELESERKRRTRLEHRLETIAKNKLRQTRQQTRIMRQQEEVVRDLSCELDQVSKKLKKSVKATFSWEDKAKELEQDLEKKHREILEITKDLENTNEIIKQQKKELEDAQTIVELYEQLKVQSRTEEVRLGRERKNFYNQAKQIYKSYREIQNDISRSEVKLKEKLSKSSVFPLKMWEDEKKEKKMKEEKESEDEERQKDNKKREKILNKRVNVFKTENAFLKKKIIGLLNQFCAELDQDQSQISDIELSFYQKSLKHTRKKSRSFLPINKRRASINKLILKKKNNENENSLFKINTLKLSEMNFKNFNENKKKKFCNNQNKNNESNVVKSSRHIFKSKKDFQDLKEKEYEDCHQSIKSDLVSSKQMKISCIESSSVIGGQTFHVLTQQNIRKISKNSENDNKNQHFISKIL